MRLSRPGLVDTNILVYSVNLDSTFHRKAKAFLEFGFSKQSLCLTPQVILELFNIISSPKFTTPLKPMAIKKVMDFFSDQTKFSYIYPEKKTFQKAIQIATKTKSFGKQKIFDAYLAATCLENKISVIYTHNPKDFKIYKGITPIDPLQ